VTPLAWWEHAQVGGLTVTAVPARHAVPENGYVIEAGGVSVYMAGDTRRFPELTDIATRFPRVDAALLPVGGERFLGLRREMGPDEAAEAAKTLGAQRVIPIGYGERGVFPFRWHARRPVDRFIEASRERGFARDRIVVLEPGESWHFYR
jgi:L-ascorbate metabolism protein UlaG (beta-lactamase superfamily)